MEKVRTVNSILTSTDDCVADVRSSVEERKDIIKNRQKLIKIAVRSKGGDTWPISRNQWSRIEFSLNSGELSKP